MPAFELMQVLRDNRPDCLFQCRHIDRPGNTGVHHRYLHIHQDNLTLSRFRLFKSPGRKRPVFTDITGRATLCVPITPGISPAPLIFSHDSSGLLKLLSRLHGYSSISVLYKKRICYSWPIGDPILIIKEVKQISGNKCMAFLLYVQNFFGFEILATILPRKSSRFKV